MVAPRFHGLLARFSPCNSGRCSSTAWPGSSQFFRTHPSLLESKVCALCPCCGCLIVTSLLKDSSQDIVQSAAPLSMRFAAHTWAAVETCLIITTEGNLAVSVCLGAQQDYAWGVQCAGSRQIGCSYLL